MKARFSGTMLAIVLSSVISASVAVVVTQMVAPQYASANSTATRRSKAPTLTSVNKTVVADFKATDATLSSIEGQLNALKSNVGTVSTSVAALKTSVAAVGTTASAASSGLTAITPVVHTIAERLYDTCALTSSLWVRSFPDPEGQTSAAAWTTTIGFETEGSPLFDVERCYSGGALVNESNPDEGGILSPAFDPDDSWTANGP